MNGHRQSDRPVVPAIPPDKAPAAEAGEERGRVMVAAAFDPVRQRLPECGAFGGELVNGIFDEIGGLRFTLAERQVPRLDLVMEADLPGHTLIMTYRSCPAR